MKSKKPFISIIMNCFNSDAFLAQAINSVYEQTYTEWEIIFWDNNSNDKSAGIAKSYDKKLKYYKSKKTTSLYEARNLAVEKSTGNYIAFLDCDDVWLPTKLQLQVAEACNGYDFIYGGYDIVDGSGKHISVNLNYLISGFITNSLFRRNPISIGCVLINKRLINEHPFDPNYDLLGDYDLWMRLSINNEIRAIPEVVEHCRDHERNISKTLQHKWLSERRYFYRKYLRLGTIFKYPWYSFYIMKTEILGILNKS